ncbi:MAG: hypothetical protein KAK00_03100 [Nanoarchaeota archaeon]|nr:hypothetical protein [Nanoarchaeota archaeon]
MAANDTTIDIKKAMNPEIWYRVFSNSARNGVSGKKEIIINGRIRNRVMIIIVPIKKCLTFSILCPFFEIISQLSKERILDIITQEPCLSSL